MIRSTLTLMAWAALAALAFGLAGCESTGTRRVDSSYGYYDDPYWRDTYYRYGCCYNEKGIVRPPRQQAPGRQPTGHRPLPAAPRPPPPPPPPPP